MAVPVSTILLKIVIVQIVIQLISQDIYLYVMFIEGPSFNLTQTEYEQAIKNDS